MLKKLVIIFQISLLFAMAGLSASGKEDQPAEEDKDYASEVEKQFGVVDNPEIVSRVQKIRDKLVEQYPQSETDKREIIAKVLDDPTVNAFALPDGHVYFFKGLIDKCETDDMLAGVMAHEFTHVYHKHHDRMGERQIRGIVAGLIAAVATGDAQAAILGQMLSAGMVETYGRFAEEDADSTGVLMMTKAGYDPVGYIELLQVLEQEAIHSPSPGGNYFTVHPWPDQRMANIRKTLSEEGIEIPEIVFRVHLPLVFVRPLSGEEIEDLEQWKSQMEAEEPGTESEIPIPLYNEYLRRMSLFETVSPPESIEFYGIVLVGDKPVFYITGKSEEELQKRASDLISSLGDVLLSGLREYEVQAKTIEGEPNLVARRKRIIESTEMDGILLGKSKGEINAERVRLLKDILYFYYVNRRV